MQLMAFIWLASSYFVIVRRVFSAVVALKSRSSMVAVKVASLPSHLIWVITLLFSRTVLTRSPAGALKLSGETALAIASAVFSSLYSSWTVASKLLTLQLATHEFVCGFNESLNLIQRYL